MNIRRQGVGGLIFSREKITLEQLRLKAVIGAQVRLAAVNGDVFALGGKALDLLDSVEQVSINKTKKDFLKSSQHQSSHFDRLPVLLTSSSGSEVSE